MYALAPAESTSPVPCTAPLRLPAHAECPQHGMSGISGFTTVCLVAYIPKTALMEDRLHSSSEKLCSSTVKQPWCRYEALPGCYPSRDQQQEQPGRQQQTGHR